MCVFQETLSRSRVVSFRDVGLGKFMDFPTSPRIAGSDTDTSQMDFTPYII